MLIYFVLYNLIHFGPRNLPPSFLDTSFLFSLLKFESPLHFSPLTRRVPPPTPIPVVTGSQRRGLTFRWLTNLKFSEVKPKFPWERNAHNIPEIP